MKKVSLNEDRCIGCGACMSVAPDNFTFNDEGRAEIISNEITNQAIEASEMCPVSAITIEDSGCKSDCTCGEECSCTEENNCGCKSDCTCGDNCDCTVDNRCSENCNCSK